MKRSLSLWGAFLLLLSLSACRFALPGTADETPPTGSEPDPASAEEEALPLSPGLYELLRFDNNRENEYLLSSAVRGDEAIVCASKSEPASEDEELFLIFADLLTGKVSERVPMEPYYDPDHPEPSEPDPWSEFPGLYLSQLAIGDNGTLVLYSQGADWAALYDRSGRLLDMIPYGSSVEQSYYAEYPLLPRSAGIWDGFAEYSFPDERGKNISAFSFLDEPSAVYLFENEYSTVAVGSGRNVICTRYADGDVPLSFRVFDFDAATVRDTADIPRIFSDGDASYNGRLTHLETDCALITTQAFRFSETDGGGDCVELVYLWRFDPEHEEPLALERNTEFSLWRKNRLLQDEILKEYEITLHLNEAPPEEYTTWDDSGPGDPVPSVCVTGAPELDIYRLQLALKGFLEKLPAGFTHEMYTDYPDTAVDHKSFDIYLVKEIPGSAAAFASGFSTGQFLICFASDEFYESHLPHEFMHLIEVRVHAFEESEGRNFWEEWDAMNPADFYYDSDEFIPEYFPTWYAMTDSMEDRADTFMTIFQHALSPDDPDPFADYPHLKAKAELLLASIRAAYPSAAAEEKLFWES